MKDKCGGYSGSLNCGCCDTVSAHCEKKPNHKGKCKGTYYEITLSWIKKAEDKQ